MVPERISDWLIYIFYIFFVDSAYRMYYPFQIDYGEGFLLEQAKTIIEGSSIYQEIDSPPYRVANYPPVYPYLVSLLLSFFGVSFMPGRLISFISTIVTGYLIYKIVSKLTNRRVGLTSSLVFFASPYIFSWGTLHRVDMLALCFSLIGIYIIHSKEKELFSIPFFVLSLYTKQSFLAAPITIFFFLAAYRGIRRALFFAFLTISVYLLLFSIINFFTAGQFYLHTILYNANYYNIYQTISFFVKLLWTHGVVITLSFWFIASSFYNKEPPQIMLFCIYFVLSFLISVITIGKVGASINYFVEPIAASCILFGLAFKKFLHLSEANGETIRKFLYIALIAQLISFAHMPFMYPSLKDFDNEKQVSAEVQKHIKILSEDGGILVINGKEVYFQPFEFTQLALQGIWDQRKIIDEISNKNFDLIILEFNVFDPPKTDRFTPEMIKEIEKHYCLITKLGKKYLYKPCIGIDKLT